MNDLVGIIRKAEEMEQALARLAEFRGRIAKMTVEGHRQFNPGWHLALDLRNMLTVSRVRRQGGAGAGGVAAAVTPATTSRA